MFMTHLSCTDRSVLSLRYWRGDINVVKAWIQTPNQVDWEPCDPNIIEQIGRKLGIVHVCQV